MEDIPKLNFGKILKAEIDSTDRHCIMRVLMMNDYRVNESAKMLGISRITLWRKMKKYNIQKAKSRRKKNE